MAPTRHGLIQFLVFPRGPRLESRNTSRIWLLWQSLRTSSVWETSARKGCWKRDAPKKIWEFVKGMVVWGRNVQIHFFFDFKIFVVFYISLRFCRNQTKKWVVQLKDTLFLGSILGCFFGEIWHQVGTHPIHKSTESGALKLMAQHGCSMGCVFFCWCYNKLKRIYIDLWKWWNTVDGNPAIKTWDVCNTL